LPEKGKTFEIEQATLLTLAQIPGIAALSQTLEETALFEIEEKQVFGKIKGVDPQFVKVNRFEEAMLEGTFDFSSQAQNKAVVGYHLGNRLGLNLKDPLTPFKVYMVKTTGGGPMGGQPFLRKNLSAQGIFAIQQEIDRDYVLTSLDFAQELLQKKNQISALEIGLQDHAKESRVRREILEVLQGDFVIQNRFEQDASFLKLMNIEKWISFTILCLAIALVAFNLVGALWLIVVDKRVDFSILKSLGMKSSSIKKAVIYLGALLGTAGMVLGSVLALIVYQLHQHFGLVRLEGAIIDQYPSELRPFDFAMVTLVVIGIALLSALPAAYRSGMITTTEKK
jgi:lipoprotein-releasing system permease protein